MIHLTVAAAAPHESSALQVRPAEEHEVKTQPEVPPARHSVTPGNAVPVAGDAGPSDETQPGFQDLLHRILSADNDNKPVPVAGKFTTRNPVLPVAAHKAPTPSKTEDLYVPVLQLPDKASPLPFAFNLSMAAPDTDRSPSSNVEVNSGTPSSTSAKTDARGSATVQHEEQPEQLAPLTTVAFSAQIKSIGEPEAPAHDRSSHKDQAGAETPNPEVVSSVRPSETPARFDIGASSVTTSYSATPAIHATPTTVAIESAGLPVQTTAPGDPVRDISFQLPGARGVEVRVSERSGEVRVDVRSGDPALTQDLRGNLRELVNGLERKGFSAEVSHPEISVANSTRPGDTGLNKDHPQQQESNEGRSGDSRQQQKQNQQDPEPALDLRSLKSRAAAWTAAFHSNVGSRNA